MGEYRLLRTYKFTAREQDPVCDELKTLVDDRGMLEELGRVAVLAGLAHATVTNLFNGETKKPQNRTVMGIATALGYRREWVAANGFDVEAELTAARAWNAKERKRIAERNRKR